MARDLPWRTGADADDEVFDAALATALGLPEIKSSMASVGLSAQHLRNVAGAAQGSILAAAEQAESKYVMNLATARRNLVSGAVPRPIWWTTFGLVLAGLVGLIAWGVWVAANALVDLFERYVTPLVSKYVTINHTWLLVFMVVIVCVAIVMALGYVVGAAADWLMDSRGLVHWAEVAFDDWLTDVVQLGVLPVLRTELNSRQDTYATELTKIDATGLLSGDPLSGHQQVRAGLRLARIVDTLGGGSFALAGPRGAGKSSLLRAFCAGSYRAPKGPPDLTVLVAAPVEYVPREFVLHLYRTICQEVLNHGSAGALAADAEEALRRIAYVQTVSGETTGKVGFRGFEVTRKKGISLAGRPPTYPELVDEFRTFVRTAVNTLDGRVIIAIDELDRIGAGEPARRFLNEIKAIFDIPGCYYLVSVSTEAQHDFELSGIGLRTAFDSSFDEVIRVDHLDFDFARRMLRRSVLGLSNQFLALAYTLSGGLARQLVRSARAIVDLEQERSLSAVTCRLVTTELGAVCQTTAEALTALDGATGITELLRALEDRPTTSSRLMASYQGESAAIIELRDLAAARIAFLEVVTEVFDDNLTKGRMKTTDFDALARARRYVGSNPATGLEMLEDFRTAWRARPAPTRRPR